MDRDLQNNLYAFFRNLSNLRDAGLIRNPVYRLTPNGLLIEIFNVVSDRETRQRIISLADETGVYDFITIQYDENTQTVDIQIDYVEADKLIEGHGFGFVPDYIYIYPEDEMSDDESYELN